LRLTNPKDDLQLLFGAPTEVNILLKTYVIRWLATTLPPYQ
jgi:hypothetical protein